MTNMPCSVLPWQAAWQVILMSLKSPQRCAGRKNLEIRDPITFSISCSTYLCLSFFKNLDTFFMKQRNSLSYEVRNLWKMSLGSGGGCSVCLWRCRPLSVPLGEQVSEWRWNCSSLNHLVQRCFGTKWYDEVPGARNTRDGDTGK